MNFREILAQITWRTVLDIALVAVLFYQIITMLKGTRAAQVLVGMAMIFVGYVVSSMLELETLNWLISKFFSSFLFVVIVLFQDDIRRLLTRFGRGPFTSGLDANSGLRVIDEVMNAAKNLSHDRIGALIVFERVTGLDRLYDHNVPVDALVSEQLLVCIFQSFSPLHDGAVIVQKNRLSCASAQLPLSKNPLFSKKLGTRHSAAVGISEETDAVVLVVSEETGNISVAWEGQLQKQPSIDSARRILTRLILPKVDRQHYFGAALSKSKKYLPQFIFNTLRKLNQPIVGGAEKRKSGARDRRNEVKKETHTDSEISSTIYENRLASMATPINLRFPRYAKIRSTKTDGSHLVLSGMHGIQAKDNSEENKNASDFKGKTETNFKNSRDEYHSHEGFEDLSTDDDHEHSNTPEKIAIEQNQAAVALSQMGPEDKFDPPSPRTPPPRDISIGGKSMNPPIENNDDSSEKRKKN